eukprot:Hpha_TRINITY_DN15353_c0_g7::TRINITY_DN15353_c0_g7_i1::g.87756::m.87756
MRQGVLLLLAVGVAADTCANFCGNNNDCKEKHYCGMGCSSDKDCDKTGCTTCDVGDRTCRPPRPPTDCKFTNITETQIFADYKMFNTLAALDDCQAECCKDDVCSAVTWTKNAWGTLCYLHNHTDHQAKNNVTTVYIRQNPPNPPLDNTNCTRCDLLDGQCSEGYGCGCPCAVDTDCNNHGATATCAKCVGATSQQDGLCGGAPAAKADACFPPYPGEPHKNCSAMMDLVFLLDGSGSISPSDWVLVKRFTMQIGLNFSSAPALMNYGIIQFSDDAVSFLNLTAGNSSFQLAMNTLPQFARSTNTGSGMQAVADMFSTQGRGGAYRVVVLITDGLWNNGPDPVPIAQQLIKDGAHIYSIAVGSASISNVQKLTSLPLENYYFNVTDESQLPVILHHVVNNMCARDA